MTYGINIHAPAGESLARAFDDVCEVGFDLVRVDFPWPFIEPEQGVWDWSRYDAITSMAAERGVQIIGILSYTPQWATDGHYWSGVPRSIGDWMLFCTQVALRYRGLVALWEAWNEPNLPWHFAGSCTDYIDRILIPASNAIHALSGQLVGGPSLAHMRSWYKWLRRIAPHRDPDRYDGRLDVLTHHAYAPNLDRLERMLTRRSLARRLPCLWWLVEPSVADVLRYADQSPSGLWLTETGWDEARIGEEAQAEQYRECLSGMSAILSHVNFYELRDDARYAQRWGIVRSDNGRKAAWYACREALG